MKAAQLSSGYWHLRGDGPCNWAQPPQWPCDEITLREHASPEASEEFLRECMHALHSMTDNEFWEDILHDHAEQGRIDADEGLFRPPYDDGSDPEEQDANNAYREAWRQRRRLLGEKFAWSDW